MATSSSAKVSIPVLYDETHRGKWCMQPEVASVGNACNLLGYLPDHAADTDGSFAVCMAAGNVTLVSKKLYESIPKEHRPALDTKNADIPVSFSIFGGSEEALGSIIMPIVLTDASTGKQFCIKLYALVLENLLMGMFIGLGGVNFVESEARGGGGNQVFNEFREWKKGHSSVPTGKLLALKLCSLIGSINTDND